MIGQQQRRSDALLCDGFCADLVPDVEADVSDMKTADARAFADAAYTYTGVEVWLWVHDMANLIDTLRARVAELEAERAAGVPADVLTGLRMLCLVGLAHVLAEGFYETEDHSKWDEQALAIRRAFQELSEPEEVAAISSTLVWLAGSPATIHGDAT